MQYLYSPDVDPTSPDFQTEPVVVTHDPADKKTLPKTMADLINVTLRDECAAMSAL